MGTPFTFQIDRPVQYQARDYTELRFSRSARPADLLAIKGLSGRRAFCAFYGRLADVPAEVIDSLADDDFVRLNRETDGLFELS